MSCEGSVYTEHTLCDLFTGMLERQKQSVCSQVPSSLDTTNFFTFLPSFVLKNDSERTICAIPVNVICKWVCPGRGGAGRGGLGLSQRPPVHRGYCFDSSGVMRELLLGCWEGKWRHSSLDPFPAPGKPIPGRLPHHSQGSRATAAAQCRRGPGDSKHLCPSTG